ncbi:stage V sporulation protein AB [Paenibacillus sp. FSL R5-0473]|uniref:stage V sporulation protein AB n=1 Tax=Paenibacillus sp. FSL R5-0473 TaxID=2921642 RepID=UPI0030FB96C5
MRMSVLNGAISIVLGIAGGIAVGSGVIALILVLNMIPRLAQLTQSYDKTHWYEGALIGGSLLGTVADFWHWKMHGVLLLSPIVGLFCGVFIGLLAAALTEVLNVLPVLAKRLGMKPYLFGLLLAMILGKMTGSLFDFFIYQR